MDDICCMKHIINDLSKSRVKFTLDTTYLVVFTPYVLFYWVNNGQHGGGGEGGGWTHSHARKEGAAEERRRTRKKLLP